MKQRPGWGEGDNEVQALGPQSLSSVAGKENSNCRAGRKSLNSRHGNADDNALKPAKADNSKRDDARKWTVFRCQQTLQNGISRVNPLQRVLDQVADSSVAAASSSAHGLEDARTGGAPAVSVPERFSFIRLPFSTQRVPLRTRSPRTLSKTGPRLHTVGASLLQCSFSCCSSTLKTLLSLDHQVLNAYICAHLLQELAARIQQRTGLIVDPLAKEHTQAGTSAPRPVETSFAGGELDEARATGLGPRRDSRVYVQLVHVYLADCHLFREEDRLAKRLLELFQSTVSVFCKSGEVHSMQGLLQQHLQQLPQLTLQLQRLRDWLARVKTENVQLWKQWLHHPQQRRVLRHQRDHEAHQFAAADRAVESLWQSLEQQRHYQKFDGTGLQMQDLLLGRDEFSDRQQLLEEVVSELEEVLAYVEAFARVPRSAFRARDMNSADAGSGLASLSKKTTSLCLGVEGAEARKECSLLPIEEQLRRFLCQNLSAVVTCRVNGWSTGRQKHVALHFPFFSTSHKHGIMSPVLLEDLPPEVQQTEEQQSDSVVASFEAALSVPLSRLSIHLGLMHPGLVKPLEAQTEVPLASQLEELTSQLVCKGGAAEKQSLAGSAGFPVAVNLDLPFSFTRVTGKETQGQRVPAVSAFKAAVHLPPLESMQASTVRNDCWVPRRSVGSTADVTQGGPCVLPLPSFLSPEATAARVQELQNYPLLSTPQWGPDLTAEGVIPDLHQVALAASLVSAESHSHALASSAAQADGIISASPNVAVPALAVETTPAAALPPVAAAAKASGLLRFSFRKMRHPASDRSSVWA
ncbi:hypothetical protein Esti_001800 [Eimeria stiedai]